MTIRHDCTHGCWVKNFCPDFKELDLAAPRTTRVSDVDAILDNNGNFLFIEWKMNTRQLTPGQEILIKNLTRHAHFKGLQINYRGAGPSTEIIEWRWWIRGTGHLWRKPAIHSLGNEMQQWAEFCRTHAPIKC